MFFFKLLLYFQDKKKGKNDEPNLPSLFIKVAFWMLTTFTLIILSSLLVPGDNTQNEVKKIFPLLLM